MNKSKYIFLLDFKKNKQKSKKVKIITKINIFKTQ